MILQALQRHTKYYLVPAGAERGLLLFDAGWPGDLPGFVRALKDAGLGLDRLAAVMVSHWHIDHAGLVGELQARGLPCLDFGGQAAAIGAMEDLIARHRTPSYRPVVRDRLTRLEVADSRAFLAGLGVGGQVLSTPGHSEDSVSLVLDSGEALIGDLYPESQVMPDDAVSRDSWARLRAAGARHILPSHAEAFDLS